MAAIVVPTGPRISVWLIPAATISVAVLSAGLLYLPRRSILPAVVAAWFVAPTLIVVIWSGVWTVIN